MKNTVYHQNGFKIIEDNGFYYVKKKSFSWYFVNLYCFIKESEKKKQFDKFSAAYNYVKTLQKK